MGCEGTLLTDNKNSTTYQISFFAALCMFLSAVEYAIPKPLPFLRLGLANLPILLAIKKMRRRDVWALILLKILGQSFISGTLFSYIFVFSAAGSFASGLTMLFVYDICSSFKRKVLTTGEATNQSPSNNLIISNIGLSLAGALANNGAQLLCAQFMMFGSNTKYIAPILLTTGCITGLALGIFANLFEEQSVWFAELPYYRTKNEIYGDSLKECSENEQNVPKESQGNEKETNEPQSNENGTESGTIKHEKSSEVSSIIWFVCSLVAMAGFLFIKDVFYLWIAVVIFYVATLIRRKGKVKVLPSILITVTVTFFALLSPYGKVLFTIGSWRITKDALFTGLHRSGILVGMVFLSQCAVSKNVKLPGRAGAFLSEMFSVFEQLTAKRISFKWGKIISAIDTRLCEMYKK